MKTKINTFFISPARFFRFSVFYLLALVSVSSCIEPENPSPTPETEQGGGANTVRGKIVDAQGKPMGGVKVRADNPSGNNIFVEGTSAADGTYKLTLTSIGGWKIYAWKDVIYKDKVYHMRLGMNEAADYDSFTPGDKGVVRNFVWKLSGRIPDRGISTDGLGYFGGALRFVNVNSRVPEMPAGTKVTVTLTPTTSAKYLDGTPATAAGIVKKTFTITNAPGQNYYMVDVPVTEYRMSIESELNGVKKQVYVGGNDYNNLYEWLEFDFNPAPGSSGSFESGIISPNDFPFYMGQKN
jgi:hypothetical protein